MAASTPSFFTNQPARGQSDDTVSFQRSKSFLLIHFHFLIFFFILFWPSVVRRARLHHFHRILIFRRASTARWWIWTDSRLDFCCVRCVSIPMQPFSRLNDHIEWYCTTYYLSRFPNTQADTWPRWMLSVQRWFNYQHIGVGLKGLDGRSTRRSSFHQN